MDIHKFDRFVATKMGRNIIRTKGVCYFASNRDMSYVFEQSGVQKKIQEAGLWFATAPEDEVRQLVEQDPTFLQDWDPEVGDRMQKIVFIGQHLDKAQIKVDLDDCLV